MIKKFLYITLTTTGGFLVSVLLHVGIEIILLNNLVQSINRDTWQLIHVIGTVVISIVGIIGGYSSGVYWIKHYRYWSYLGFKKKG